MRWAGHTEYIEVRARGPSGVVYGTPGAAMGTLVTLEDWRRMPLEVVDAARRGPP